jgi:hypothetical protein
LSLAPLPEHTSPRPSASLVAPPPWCLLPLRAATLSYRPQLIAASSLRRLFGCFKRPPKPSLKRTRRCQRRCTRRVPLPLLLLIERLSLGASVTLRPGQDAQTPIARHVSDVLGVHGVRTRPERLSASDPQRPAPPVPGTSPGRPPLLNASPSPVLRAVVKAARRVPVLQRRARRIQVAAARVARRCCLCGCAAGAS